MGGLLYATAREVNGKYVVVYKYYRGRRECQDKYFFNTLEEAQTRARFLYFNKQFGDDL